MIWRSSSDMLVASLRHLVESDALPDSRLAVEVRSKVADCDSRRHDDDSLAMVKILASFINPELYKSVFSKDSGQRQSDNGEIDMDKMASFLDSIRKR